MNVPIAIAFLLCYWILRMVFAAAIEHNHNVNQSTGAVALFLFLILSECKLLAFCPSF